MDTNTKEVIEQFGTKLDSYIQVLAEKLGVAAEYIYPLFVKQQVIEGVTYFCLFAFFFILAFSLLIVGLNSGKKTNWKEGVWISFCAISILIYFFLTLEATLGGKITENLTKIINPEYAAIEELVQMVK